MLAKLSIVGTRYSGGELLGAGLMSAGMAVTVVAKLQASTEAPTSATAADAGELGLAAGVLVLGLYALGVQKVLQERAFDKYGQAIVGEMVFWQHCWGLPLLLGEYKSVMTVVVRWWSMAPLDLAARLGLETMPIWLPPPAWLLLGCNIWLNATATSALLRLVSVSSSLVASLGVTMYRFGAILVSSLVLNAPPYPPPLMGLGCALVPSGSLAYIYSSKRAAAAANAKGKARSE